MKVPNQTTRFAGTIWLLALAWAAPYGLYAAANPSGVESHQMGEQQRTFASPDDAVKALQGAAEAQDQKAICEIFGPETCELMTGDQVQDANNQKRFAAVCAQGCKQVKEGEDKIVLEVGTNEWPMPIPLVKTNGQWRFDTEAGKEEIINRHIGRDELNAIGVCQTYVEAQQKYASLKPDGANGVVYAQKFKSMPGKKDGLYWPTTGNEPASPFGALMAAAHEEGYANHNRGTGPHAFHGYYFRILTRQGKDAPGGKINYLRAGEMTRGFALVAYPVIWGQSGVMTFIVNQDGKIYQRDLGEQTAKIAGAMREYNPDGQWTPVQEKGMVSAAAGR